MFKHYSEALTTWPEYKDLTLPDVLAAVRKLSIAEREEGETAFPSLAKVGSCAMNAGYERRREERDRAYEAEMEQSRLIRQAEIAARDAMTREERDAADAADEQRARERLAKKFPGMMVVAPIAKKPVEPLYEPPPAEHENCPACDVRLPWPGSLSTFTAIELRLLADSMDRRAAYLAEAVTA